MLSYYALNSSRKQDDSAGLMNYYFVLSLVSMNGILAPTSMSPLTEPDGRKRVVVVGSGDFGLALTGRLVQADYSVVVASRNPDRTRSVWKG